MCCLATVQRKFFKSLNLTPDEAEQALLQIQAIYAVIDRGKLYRCRATEHMLRAARAAVQ